MIYSLSYIPSLSVAFLDENAVFYISPIMLHKPLSLNHRQAVLILDIITYYHTQTVPHA